MYKKSWLIVLWSGAVMACAPAFGHAKLISSHPADHSRLTSAPATLTLTFNETAQVANLKLKSALRAIPVTIDRTAKAATTVSVALPALDPGTYEVQWTALAAEDGHITNGTFTFTIIASPSP